MATNLPDRKLKTYRMKRYLIEEYEILAFSKKEAIEQLKKGLVYDPVSIKIQKETMKLQ